MKNKYFLFEFFVSFNPNMSLFKSNISILGLFTNLVVTRTQKTLLYSKVMSSTLQISTLEWAPKRQKE